MHIHVQTRGRTAGYAYLGSPPDRRWWLDFRDATSFEQPTIIVWGDMFNWRCYLSGIPSVRTDHVGTVIRYTVVLEGFCNEPNDEALGLVTAWLEDAAASVLGRRVQAEMDKAFDEAAVERLLALRTREAATDEEVQRSGRSALSNLLPTRQVSELTEAVSWAGSRTSLLAQREFLARSGELVRGERVGTAALLNLLGTPAAVEQLAAQPESLGSLAALIDADPALGDGIVAFEKKKSAATRPGPGRSRPIGPWMLVGLLLGIILLVIWLLLPRPTAPLTTPTSAGSR